MKTCVLVGLIIALSVISRADDLVLNLGPEIVVAGNVPGHGLQSYPSVAFNGEVYLVVWQEGPTAPGSGGTDIYGARLDKQGKPLDLEGIPISKAREHQEKPVVAASGKDFMVLWQDYRNGKDWDVYGARVTGEGKVLDPEGIAIATGPGSQGWPALASDGKTGYLAAWMSYDEEKWNYDILAAHISPEGRILDKPAVIVASGDSQQITPCAAWIDGRYAVAWVDVERNVGRTAIFFSWVGLKGKAEPATQITRYGNNILPSMAGGKKMGALGWSLHHGKTYDPRYLCAALIRPDGTLVAAAQQGDLQELDAVARKLPYIVAPYSSNVNARGTSKLWTATVQFGSDFVIFWTEKKWGEDTEIGADTSLVFGARVLADGARCPDRKSPIGIGAQRGANYMRPAASPGPEGEALVVYERDKAIGDHKIAARLIKK